VGVVIGEERTSRPNGPVSQVHDPAPAVIRVPPEAGPMPSWPDVRAVLLVCVPSWAGLTWLISEWV
jgi:hypothetical protein